MYNVPIYSQEVRVTGGRPRGPPRSEVRSAKQTPAALGALEACQALVSGTL